MEKRSNGEERSSLFTSVSSLLRVIRSLVPSVLSDQRKLMQLDEQIVRTLPRDQRVMMERPALPALFGPPAQ